MCKVCEIITFFHTAMYAFENSRNENALSLLNKINVFHYKIFDN